MKKEDITKVISKNKDHIETMGFKVSPSGKQVNFQNYKIDVIVSKYGYDDTYGLDFFLRATNKNAPRDEWGNILDSFAPGVLVDITPRHLNKKARSELRDIYGQNRFLAGLDNYFCALDEGMLNKVVVFAFENFAACLSNNG